MNDTPRVTAPVEPPLVDWFSQFIDRHQEGCGSDTDALIACLDRVRDSYRSLSAAPAPEGGAVAEALQRLRVLRDQARNGTAVSDPDEYDADELDGILSVIEPALAAREAGERDRVKRAIADGFSNGYEQYDDASEMQRLSYDMAADAVLALRAQPQARSGEGQ